MVNVSLSHCFLYPFWGEIHPGRGEFESEFITSLGFNKLFCEYLLTKEKLIII